MASKTICSVPLSWTLADYDRHNCGDGSHVHLSFTELSAHEKKNIVKHLRTSKSRNEKTVVQIEVLEIRDDSWAGRPSARRESGEAMNGGLSFRVGEYLAKRVRQQKPWALVMLAHINNCPAKESIAESEAEFDRFMRLDENLSTI